MYEGQNIHLSPVDGKRLCSFSRKICKQRRLNGYGFCIRHILEDTYAPFKQCQFKMRSNGERCFNPVPQSADRIYCNSHLQVLGLLPKHYNKKKQTMDNKEIKPVKTIKWNVEHTQSETKKKKKRNTKKYHESDTKAINWQKSVAKFLSTSAQTLESWKQKEFHKNVELFRHKRPDRKSHENLLDYHKIEKDYTDTDCVCTEAFQSFILTSPERVHHNTLRADSANFQEQKILCKLKHQYGQLKQVVQSKNESGLLSYTVLSKLVAAARSDALETANVLNLEGKTTCSSHRLRARRNQVVYKVPCCLITGNERCTNTALPYMRYCREHSVEDSDQLLFSKIANPGVKKSSSVPCHLTTFRFLQDDREMNQWKQTNDVTGGHSTSKQRKHTVNIKRNNKNIELRKVLKKSSTAVSLKAQMRKKFAIPNKPVQKLNAHVHSISRKSSNDDDESRILDVVNGESVMSDKAETTDDSDDEDFGSDTLTPEEAFHLPPGSLSTFSPQVDDEDSFSNIRRTCEIDDDDDEFIRCSNTFEPFERNSQLARDLTSPTLNQLSSSDFDTFNMLFSPTKTMNPTSEDVSPRTTSMLPSYSNVNSMSSVNEMHKSLLANQKSHSQSTTVTSLKISPVSVNNTSRRINFNAGYMSKHVNSSVSRLPVNMAGVNFREKMYRPVATYGSCKQVPFRPHQLSTESGAHLTNGIGSRHNVTQLMSAIDENLLNKRYLNDSLLTNQPFLQDTTLFDDIRTDVDSPLEKVNPDIFFSSVFPVATSTANM